MTLVARALMDAARDLHPAFDLQSNPDIVLLRALSRYQKSLWSKTLQRYPSISSAEQSIDVPLSDNDHAAGTVLVSTLAIADVSVKLNENDERYPFDIIPSSHKADAKALYSGWIENGRLFLRGRPADWTGVDSVIVTYTDDAEALTGRDDELILDDSAEDACVTRLASVMAGRGTKRKDVERPNPTYFQNENALAEIAYLDGLWLKSSATSYDTRDVMG